MNILTYFLDQNLSLTSPIFLLLPYTHQVKEFEKNLGSKKKKHRVKEVHKTGLLRYFVAINTVFHHCVQILYNSSPKCILAVSGCDNVLNELLQFPDYECFYGKYFGIQFSDSLRIIFTYVYSDSYSCNLYAKAIFRN